jgi:uncharacterized protein (DUF305 family)
MKLSSRQIVFASLALAMSAAFADSDLKPPMAGHDHMQDAAPQGILTGSTQGYEAAMSKMHKAMEITYSGDPDIDFARGMIPHHQGAIDMAQVELQYGKSPEMRKIAEAIIKAQEEEIAQFNSWLGKSWK